MGTEHNYEELLASRKSIYETVDKAGLDAIFAYAEEYKKFLEAAKTEREATVFAVSMAEKAGYTPYTFGDALKPGDRRYFVNKGKGIYLFRIGTAPLSEVGFRILAAHIDSPRIDLKQNPLYEDSGMSFFKTHYYGGIKKYQWTALPLALHGVIVRADGETVTVSIGEEPGDPVFYINDLLPHLGQEQAQQPLGKAISGESLNLLVGGIPVADGKEGEAIKLNVLRLLNEKYGVKEEDFLSAELSAVPAERARDVGFDRAFISAYGHDDRCCAYPALTALFDTENNDTTVFVILADKEEIGSNGNTGMRCRLFPDLL
ncbi:MAG: aminopeptidase, partial [Clostridia bacterium]|nr:aminopeptidase [Clostridia bacterium]